MTDVNNIFQVFRRWSLNERSPITQSDFADALNRVGSIGREQAASLFVRVDANRDGRINYSDLERWLLSNDILRSSKLLQKCRCPDGHTLDLFKPEVDGWCCEECGEDLDTSRHALRCDECGCVCWCVSCMIQPIDVLIIEKAILASIPTLSKNTQTTSASHRHRTASNPDPLGNQSAGNPSAVAPVAMDDSDEDVPTKKPRRTATSLDFMNEGKGTPAEQMYIEGLFGQLISKNTQSKLEALEGLSGLVKDRRLAAEVGNHIQTLIMQFERKQDTLVHTEVLSLLRRLSELGQADGVGAYAYAFAPCLADEDIVITRKAAMLFCIVAREGGASLVTRYIPKLVECFERVNHRITAPLEALQAIADGGEGMAVVPAVARLQPVLFSLNSRGRGAACNVIAATFRGGGGDGVYRELIRNDSGESGAGSVDMETSLLRVLLLFVRDEDDDDVRLLAAQALQTIVLFNEDTVAVLRNEHSLLMFNCLGTLYGRQNHEARGIIKEILGLDLSKPESGTSTSKFGDDGGPEVCSVCFTEGLRCQRGGPLTLPCGHTFHAQCIDDWFAWETKCNRERSCPLCRSCAPTMLEQQNGAQANRDAARKIDRRQNSVARLRATVSAARAFAT